MLKRESRQCVKIAQNLIALEIIFSEAESLGFGRELGAGSWAKFMWQLEAGPAAYFKMNLT